MYSSVGNLAVVRASDWPIHNRSKQSADLIASPVHFYLPDDVMQI